MDLDLNPSDELSHGALVVVARYGIIVTMHGRRI